MIEKINNWLCKHFDDERKGYVNLGDVESKILEEIIVKFNRYGVLIYISFVIFFFGGVILGYKYNTMISNQTSVTLLGFFMSLIVAWEFAFIDLGNFVISIIKIIYIPISIVIIVSYLLHKTSKIKIAKCPLAEDKL